eukprot:8135171-Alexandrium_andersonii.AAC.1
MSASLVGSEMCIRDSATPEGPAEAPRGQSQAWQGGGQGRIPREDSSQPVSYTHLTLPTICSV